MNPQHPDPSVGVLSEPSEISGGESFAASEPYVGRWHRLVSQTNWEKGRIIVEWRTALIASGTAVSSYSDEAWAQQVGAVTSQHVGRLRRVYDRFGDEQHSYEGLFWSHFLAALDWDDAELWLEGALRSGWSVSQMRSTRSEAMVAAGGEPVQHEELIAAELDDGFVPLVADENEETRSKADSEYDGETAPLAEGPDFGDADIASDSSASRTEAGDVESDSFSETANLGNPFQCLGDLPPDVADALEQFKLSIIRHRASQWSDVSQTKILEVIEALRAFACR